MNYQYPSPCLRSALPHPIYPYPLWMDISIMDVSLSIPPQGSQVFWCLFKHFSWQSVLCKTGGLRAKHVSLSPSTFLQQKDDQYVFLRWINKWMHEQMVVSLGYPSWMSTAKKFMLLCLALPKSAFSCRIKGSKTAHSSSPRGPHSAIPFHHS